MVGLAAALSHFCKEPEKSYCHRCVSQAGDRGKRRGQGRVTIGIPEPNLAECRVNSTPPRSCPNVPQSHTDFEVLNRTRHTSPKMGVNLD